MQFARLDCYVVFLVIVTLPSTGWGAEKPKSVPTAWGKPVNGLQAGIRVKPGAPSANSVLELEIVIRNVAPKNVVFRYEAGLYFWGRNEDDVILVRPALSNDVHPAARGAYSQPN